MAITSRPMTADELLRLPDDGRRHELVAGALRTMPPAGEEHGTIAMTLGGALAQYVRAHQLGRVVAAETGFLLTTDPDTVRAADVAFIGKEHAGDHPVAGYRSGAPDLVAEVVSPRDLYTEVEEKVATWLAHGTRMVLVLNPRQRTVAVHRPSADVRLLTVGDTLDGSDVVPGWSLPVRELFGWGG